MCLAERKILVGQEYNPCALFRRMETIPFLISKAVTGLKKKDSLQLPDRYNSVKRQFIGGILDANLRTTEEKWMLRRSEILVGS